MHWPQHWPLCIKAKPENLRCRVNYVADITLTYMFITDNTKWGAAISADNTKQPTLISLFRSELTASSGRNVWYLVAKLNNYCKTFISPTCCLYNCLGVFEVLLMTSNAPTVKSLHCTIQINKLYGEQQNTVHSYAFLQCSFTAVITDIGVVSCDNWKRHK
jgi:hypothetical protein